MKKYDWEHFSGQTEIVDFLNEPKNKTVIPVSINNDDRGNWWLIYYKDVDNEKTVETTIGKIKVCK